ncbi:hypothetical protein L1887_08861 [Cichorium endivia]|nr:hypothetical protein L1887_08861 [Cichorium endivia]
MSGFISVVGCRIIPQELEPLGIEEGPILWSQVFEILGDVDGSSFNLDNRRTGVNWSIARNPAAGAGEYFAPYPDQVLENVLYFLTSRRDRNAVTLVCKSWYHAEAYTRSDVFIGNCYAVAPRRVTGRFSRVRSVTPIRLGCALLAVGLHHGRALEKIHLKRMSITDDDLAMIAHSFPNFKELLLVCCEGFGML